MVQLSPETLRVDFTIPNNGDYSSQWSLKDKVTQESVLEPDCTLAMEIKQVRDEDAATVLSLSIVELASPLVSGFQMDAEEGLINILIKNDDLPDDVVPAGEKKGKLFYDLIVTYADGLALRYVEGVITVTRGVTGSA